MAFLLVLLIRKIVQAVKRRKAEKANRVWSCQLLDIPLVLIDCWHNQAAGQSSNTGAEYRSESQGPRVAIYDDRGEFRWP